MALIWLALAVCLASTLAAWYFMQREAEANAQLYFKGEAGDARVVIDRRIEGYVSMLRGTAALFNATGVVSATQWQRYIADLQLGRDWPGIQFAGYIEMLAPAKAGARQSRIAYLEPAPERTAQVFAFDPFAEPVRRTAMERARDSGEPVVTAHVILVMTAHGQGRGGFLVFVPVYAVGAASQTIEQRRGALRGFVFGVFSLPNLMRGILGDVGERIDFRVFDEASAPPEALIYDSHRMPDLSPPRYTEFSRISLPGGYWGLEMHGRPEFEASLKSGLPLAIAVGGALVNLLLLALVLVLRAHRASSAQLSKLSLALEQSPESVIITDHANRIDYVNEAFVRTTGYRREEVIGQNPRLLQSGKTPRETYVEMWATLTQGLPWRGEFNNRTKDGRDYVELAIITPLRQSNGTISHYVGVKEDITETKRMSEELDFYRRHLEEEVAQRTGDLIEARQQADDANEAKSRFLAAMSHEIRTPLNAVLGFAHLGLNLDLGARERGYLEKIHSAAGSLLGVVNDILDFSKVDAGKLQIEAIPFSLGEVLARVAALFQIETRRKGIELVVGTLPGVPEKLIGDPMRLAQVLTNLVGNAVKFTERGEIHLIVEPDSVGTEALTLRFRVRDTGIGMSPQQQTLLFKPFSQTNSSITRKYGGTGLGLALCKQLVICMGGSIDVDSRIDVGSCFSFSAGFGLFASTADAQHRQIADKKVLVVDNSATMRALLSRNLINFGCQVEAVDCGQAALARIESGSRFDLILMDWHMPGLDGLLTARDIRSAGNDVPILLVSGDEPDLARAAAREIGVVIAAFLCKPVSTPMLHDAMVNALGQRTTRVPQRVVARLSAPNLRGQRILLVDDNDFNRQIGRELVELTGAYVDTANDGAQAVEAAEGGDYDLILMDIQMPVMDGHSAARIIRERWPILPIVALTAHALNEESARVLASGMNELLAKPIVPDLLYACLTRWLSGESAVESPAAEIPRPEKPPVADVLPAPTADPRGLECFDLPMALSRVGGDRQMLDRFLRLFRERNAGIVEQIGAALAGDDHLTARRLVHALKGGAGTIGLVALQASAQRLEEVMLSAGADPTCVGREFIAVQVAWRRSMEALGTALDGVSTGGVLPD